MNSWRSGVRLAGKSYRATALQPAIFSAPCAFYPLIMSETLRYALARFGRITNLAPAIACLNRVPKAKIRTIHPSILRWVRILPSTHPLPGGGGVASLNSSTSDAF
ncbi:hypothetical protein IF2G_06761 [Cordyceps javanica]|nr:hypothetical protein IF2G_06761 [Cordyceps javanica]